MAKQEASISEPDIMTLQLHECFLKTQLVKEQIGMFIAIIILQTILTQQVLVALRMMARII